VRAGAVAGVLLVILITVALLSLLDVALLCGRVTEESYITAFDVPYCATLSSCIKQAFPVENSYAVEAGYAWLHVNELRKAWEDYVEACEEGPFSGDKIKSSFRREISDIRSKVFATFKNLVSATNRANRAAISQLSALTDSLKRRGVEDSRDAAWMSLYSEASMALRDVVNGTEKTRLGKYFNRVKDFRFSLVEVYTSPLLIVLSSLANVLPKEIKKLPILSGIVGLTRTASAEDWAEELPKVVEFVNTSVGESASVRKEMEKIWSKLRELEDRTHRDVKEMVEHVNTTVDDIYRILNEYRGVDMEALSGFLEKRVVFSPFGSSTSMVVEDARALVDRLVERFRRAVNEYVIGYRDLNAYGTMKEIKVELDQVHEEVKRFDGVVSSGVERCAVMAKSYVPRLKETEEALEARLRVFKDASVGEKIELCREMREIIAVDGEEAKAKSKYEACLQEVRKGWGINITCSGTYREKYLCCSNILDNLKKELMLTEAYQLYLKLRDELLKLYDRADDATKAQVAALLISKPKNPEELGEVLKKMSSLLEKIPGEVESRWEGVIRSDAPSRVTLTITATGNAKGKIKIPFDYLSYEVEGNLPVSVEGDYVKYNGEGEARITFVVPPTPLDNYVMEEENGTVVHYMNSFPVPYVLVPEGNVLDVENGREVNGVVMLRPGGGAIVKYDTVRIEPLGNGSFMIENVSDAPYSNLIEFPVVAQEVPPYCTALEDRVLCKVNLKPGEKRIIKFKLKPKVVETNTAPIERRVPPVKKPHQDIGKVVDLLMKQIKRARELNREDLIPISFEGIKSVGDNEGAYPVLKSILDKLRAKAKVSIERLKRKDAERARLAEKLYREGDYITPVVLAEEEGSGEETPWTDIFAIVGGLGLIAYGILGLRRKKLPEIRM